MNKVLFAKPLYSGVLSALPSHFLSSIITAKRIYLFKNIIYGNLQKPANICCNCSTLSCSFCLSKRKLYTPTKHAGKQEPSILFISNRAGNDEVYAMNMDGSNAVRLTFNTVPDGRASWSANGQYFAFASGVVRAKFF